MQLNRVAKIKPEQNSGLNGIRTHDLRYVEEELYHLSFPANLEQVILGNRNI